MDEDNKDQAKPVVEAPSKGVMDIQPPKPQGVVSSAPAVTPSSGEPPADTTPSPIVEAPQAPSSPVPAAETSAKPGLSPELLAQAQKETKKPAVDPKQQLLAAHGSHKRPRLVIFLAVIIALALAGVAVWAYMDSQKDPTPPAHDATHDMSSENTPQQTTTHQPATTTEVDSMTKEVDDATNSADEAQDLPDSLGDDTVGL